MTAATAPPVGHVGINVTDVDRSVAFYTAVFGFDVVAASADDADRGRRFALLGRDGLILVTLGEQAADGYDGKRAGLHHLAFGVADLDAVRAAEAGLRALDVDPFYGGVVPLAAGAEGGAVYFLDPDGTRLEILAPGGGTVDADPPFGEAPTCGFF